jgi:hypothetical protein
MITIIGNIQLRRGKEVDLPGAPRQLNPLVFSEGVGNGELTFTSDTGRVFIGHVPASSDPHYRRATFPYQNVEVLTEASPRLKELFNTFTRDQDKTTFFAPVSVTGTTITVANGTADPTVISANASATVEYHAFTAAGQPVKQGTLRIIGTNVYDEEMVEMSAGALTFGATLTSNKITIASNSAGSLKIYMKRVIINSV